MEKKIFLSIILPVYNVEAYLSRCVDGLINETFQDYEMILVDDGSKDRCPELCDRYAEQNDRIHVIHKKNGGLSSARNAGLAIAAGEYVFFLDPDDYLETGALGVIAAKLREHPVDILKFNYVFRPSGKEKHSSLQPGLYEKEALFRHVLPMALGHSGEYRLSAWSHVYRHAFLKENRLQFVSEREIGSEDYLFTIQALLKAESLFAISDVLYDHECRTGSLSRRYRPKLIEQYRRLYLALRETLGQSGRGNQLLKKLDAFYVWNSYYASIYNENRLTEQHGKKEALDNIRKLLRQRELRHALNNVSLKEEPAKHWLIWALMKGKSASGLWLLMERPGKKWEA